MKGAWNLILDGVRALRIAVLALPVAAVGPATAAALSAAGTPVPPPQMPAAPAAAPWTSATSTAGPEDDACRERCVAPEAVHDDETPAVGVAPDTTGSGCHHPGATPQ